MSEPIEPIVEFWIKITKDLNLHGRDFAVGNQYRTTIHEIRRAFKSGKISLWGYQFWLTDVELFKRTTVKLTQDTPLDMKEVLDKDR
jgi:hypothetical protein